MASSQRIKCRASDLKYHTIVLTKCPTITLPMNSMQPRCRMVLWVLHRLYASLRLKWHVQAVHSSEGIFVCQWMGPFGPCQHEFYGRDLSAHLREVHGLGGAENSPVTCAWHGCTAVLNRGNLARHVKSKHLSIMYPCATCNQRFTRQYNLSQHQTNCPGLQQ